MDKLAGHTHSFFASLKRVAQTLLATAENRLQLLLVEAREERVRLWEALLLAAGVVVLALMTLLVVTFTIVVVCVRTGRWDLLVALSLFYLLVTVGTFWRLRTRLKTWTPFSATMAELRKDMACLDEKN